MTKDNQKGMTLIETMTACVILTILMTVLIQGVLAASNWFAESNRIKDNGETVANRIEGTNGSSEVTTESQQKGYLLASDAGNVVLSDRENVKTTYSYNGVSFSTIFTDVADYVEDAKDPVYDETRKSVADIAEAIQEIVDVMNEDGAIAAGFSQESQTQSNEAWLSLILGKIGGRWPEVSSDFKNRYHLEQGGEMGANLSVRVFLVNSADNNFDFLYYICNDTGNTNNNRPFLIYDAAANVWLRCPKRGEGSNFSNYVNYDLQSKVISSEGNYSYFEEDNYVYLHEDKVEAASPQSISFSTSTELLNFIRTEGNGWDVMWPNE